MNKLKILGRFLVIVFGSIYCKLLEVIANSQISSNAVIRWAGFIPSQVFGFLGLDALNTVRLLGYISRASKDKRKRRNRIKSSVLRSMMVIAMSSPSQKAKRLVDAGRYREELSKERLDAQIQYYIAHHLFNAGRLDLACATFEDLIENSLNEFPIETRLQLLRDCGIACFMYGRNREASRYWRMAGELRQFILGPMEKCSYRIIGQSWFAAIGHVAMLDFYLKYITLFRDPSCRTVIRQGISDIPGSYLLSKFSGKRIGFIDPNVSNSLERDYNRWAKKNGRRLWYELTPAEKAAHSDDFWEFEFPDGEILGYTHAAARIQREWEKRGLQPLMAITLEERDFVARALHVLGIPKGAWYVCLHVREAGFHKEWNKLYPSMRDAEVEDYRQAMEKIVSSGGWVIRMGDPSMKRLPQMEGVVDYAHSPHKTPTADVLIPLCSRFILATNSGFATVPAIYGIKCAFTNWVPIGLPFWPNQDLVIPKLFWSEEKGDYLNLEEMFETGIAFVQNWADLPEGISLVKNTPEDICDLTEEMLATTKQDAEMDVPSEGNLFHPEYRRIAERHGSYVGSRIGSAFIKKHAAVFAGRSVDEDTPHQGQVHREDV